MNLASAKLLLEMTGSPMDAHTLFQALAAAGVMEQKRYLSSTGSGEVKQYWAFTEAGNEMGVNQATLSPTKTEPRFYDTTFHLALSAAAAAIARHAEMVRATNEATGVVGSPDQPCSGLRFVLTGHLHTFSRTEAASRIALAGGRVTETVSARTDYLVAGSDPGAKLARAMELNVPILDEDGLRHLLGMLD